MTLLKLNDGHYVAINHVNRITVTNAGGWRVIINLTSGVNAESDTFPDQAAAEAWMAELATLLGVFSVA